MNAKPFVGEFKRRHVYRVAVGYGIGGWALAQGIAQVFPIFDISNWAIRFTVVLIGLGFPIALILAWFFDLTPEGIKRTGDFKAVTVGDSQIVKFEFAAVAVAVLLITAGVPRLRTFVAP